MQIQFNDISPNQRYHLLTQTVIPRPIAWVLSENTDGSLNLAPFSFFNAMCSDPALLVMSIGKKEAGERKDTAINLLSGREFVVHIAGASQADNLTKTAASLDYGQSELALPDLEFSDSELVSFEGCSIPRLSSCDVAYHCKLYEHHLVGPNQQAFIYAEVVSLYLSEDVATQDGQRITVDANKVAPLARLGAAQYSGITQAFKVTRPK